MQKKNVVVLGAGFGGLSAARLVARDLERLRLLDKYQVLLIDRSDCHLYTPLLYKLAADGADAHSETTCTYDTTSLIKNFPITFLEKEVAALDLMNGDIHLCSGEEIKAEFLVIALGSETNYFGIPGLKENSLQLKSAESALRIREALAKSFSGQGDVKIVIGGAGPNGIELAAQIRAWANSAQKKNPNLRAEVSILEAMPTILPGFDKRVIVKATKRLHKLGIPVLTSAKITGVSPNEIAIAEATPFAFDIFIWTGGIKTPDMLTQLPLEKEPRGKPLTRESLQCLPGSADLKLYPMIYGLGDSVCFMDSRTGRPVPAVARAAILQSHVAAHNLIEEIKHKEHPEHKPFLKMYIPADYPYVIPIGKRWAVAKFGDFVFSGWSGWIFSKLVEIHYLTSIMPLFPALAAWRKMK